MPIYCLISASTALPLILNNPQAVQRSHLSCTQPEGKEYIIIPKDSSEFGRYIPIRFISPDVKVNNAVLTMPAQLRKAHKQNDLSVISAYGFDKTITESEIVAELMKMYKEMTS